MRDFTQIVQTVAQPRLVGEVVRFECPSCGRNADQTPVPGQAQVYTCGCCRAIHGTCYLGDSYGLVKPTLHEGEADHAFDFITLGSQGVGRRHGWVDAQGRMVQVG